MEKHTQQSGSPEPKSDRLGNGDEPVESPIDAFRDAAERLAELMSYVSYYISAKADQLRISVRKLWMYAGAGLVGLLAGATAIVMGVGLLCLGVAYALSAAFGRPWLGFLVAGFLIVALLAAGAFVGYIMITRSSRKRMVEKYEQFQQQQRLEFGKDVCERAAEAERD
jgi:hypothetical protein